MRSSFATPDSGSFPFCYSRLTAFRDTGMAVAICQTDLLNHCSVRSRCMKEKLVVVGNGMAGIRAVEEVLNPAPEKSAITVFGAEPLPNYNRILLSPVLSGEKKFEDIVLNDDAWYADNGITLHKGKEIVSIDRRNRKVEAKDGTEASYDRLLLATGSNPFLLPVPGKDLPGVIGFRDLADVESMLAAAGKFHHAVVIGGGLLGLEAANGLMKQGMKVTVVHLPDVLMERQLDQAEARMLRKELESRGLQFIFKGVTKEIFGKGRVQGVGAAGGGGGEEARS